MEDARRAADFLTTLPFVDAERMGVYGICAGGGQVRRTVVRALLSLGE